MRITDQLFQRREPAVLAPLTFDHLTSKTRATLHRYALGLIKDFNDISEEDRQHLRLTYHSLVPSYPETNEEFEARMIRQFGQL